MGQSGGRSISQRGVSLHTILVDSASKLDGFKSGNVITLPANALIQADTPIVWPVNTRIVFGANPNLRGFDRERDLWTFDTPGEAALTFPLTPGSCHIGDISVTQLSATGRILVSLDATAARMTLSNFVVLCNGGRGLDIAADDINIFALDIQFASHPLTLIGGGVVMVINGALLLQTVGGSGNPCVDLASNQWVFIRLANMLIISASGGVGIVGASSNGNMVDADSTGRIDEVTINGAGTTLAGITEDDLQWLFTGNPGIKNSHFSGGYSMTANATETVISTQSVWTKIAGTTVENEVHRMSMTDDNEMTITRTQPASYVVHLNVSMFKTGGATLFSFSVFVNSVLVQPPMQREVTTVTGALSGTVVVDLDAGDIIEAFTRNDENTGNITVSNMSITVTEG